MRIAREEIFGPVLSIMPYDTSDEAIEIANDTVYGLAAYVQSKDIEHARKVSRRMRTGNVYINYPVWDPARRSAATSSRATAANMANTASTISSRSRPSSATRRPEGRYGRGTISVAPQCASRRHAPCGEKEGAGSGEWPDGVLVGVLQAILTITCRATV